MADSGTAEPTDEQHDWVKNFCGLDMRATCEPPAQGAPEPNQSVDLSQSTDPNQSADPGASDLNQPVERDSDALNKAIEAASPPPSSEAVDESQQPIDPGNTGDTGLDLSGNPTADEPNQCTDPRLVLDQDYEAAVVAADWQRAAELLNAFNREDIIARLSRLSAAEIANLHEGALNNPKVGPQAQVAQLTTAGSAENELNKVSGTETNIEDISASVTLAAGQVLYSDSDQTIKTTAAIHLTIRVTSSELRVTFNPALSIESTNLLGTVVELDSLHFNYRTQKIGASWTAPNYANWWGDIGPKITKNINDRFISALPGRMLVRGYDPFSDPKLQGDLPGILAKIVPSGSASSGPKVQASDASLHADVSIKGELRFDPVSIPAGTRIGLDIVLQGDVPVSLAEAKVSYARMAFNGNQAHVNLKVSDTDIPAIFVDNVILHKGGTLSVSYTLATESIEFLIRAFVAGEALRQGQPVGPDALASKQPALRKIVDGMVHTKLEPLLRDVIIKNKDAIQGIDLAQALGL